MVKTVNVKEVWDTILSRIRIVEEKEEEEKEDLEVRSDDDDDDDDLKIGGQGQVIITADENTALTLRSPEKKKKKKKSVKGKVLESWVIRVPLLISFLYLFVCSLDLLSTSFRLVAGKAAGSIFQGNELLSNPVVSLMIGVFFTVLVQSSSTCTSVIVSMVSSDILDVEMAIPMIMGANIGTSLTNTLVSITQIGDKDQFERAFAGATVHDCFNWLTVTVLLILETTTGFLYRTSFWLTSVIMADTEPGGSGSKGSINILGSLTKPFTKKIIRIDKAVLKCWALGQCQEDRLLKVNCSEPLQLDGIKKCGFLFNYFDLNDVQTGIILLILSLTLLTLCLIGIVKVLKSLLQGAMAEMIRKVINEDIPYVPWLTGYLAILMGAALTFLVQSSSVFTSTLTPLVGIGLISVDRVYPLTLGSNLGTTTTALIASLAAEGPRRLRNSLQIALCHLLFNVAGILIFYPIPWMRWPLGLCKLLGRTTARYRWFAFLYLMVMFFIFPGVVLCLSMAGHLIFVSVSAFTALISAFVLLVNCLRDQKPSYLPKFLRNWDYLPLWMRSLEPLDGILRKIPCFRFPNDSNCPAVSININN